MECLFPLRSRRECNAVGKVDEFVKVKPEELGRKDIEYNIVNNDICPETYLDISEL
jgi:hypothetical protein